MKFTTQIRDALTYTLRDWKPIILLGLILCITSSLHKINEANAIIAIAIVIVTIIMLFLEEGYRYEIIKETIKGNNNPPKFGNLKELISEGFLESIIITVYSVGLYILTNIANNMKIISSLHLIQWAILFIIIMAIYFLFFGAAINKVLHDDKFISAFNLIEIVRFYSKIGIIRTAILIIIGSISMNFIIGSVLDLGIYNFAQYIDLLINLFINPILILFLTRLTALIGKEVTYD